MDLSEADQLLRVAFPPKPFMRLADVRLDLQEAVSATNAMHQIIQNFYSWNWPSAECHLRHQPIAIPDENDETRQRDPEESDKDYDDRMRRREAWPRVKAEEHCQWIKCAMITSRALDYLQHAREAGQPLEMRDEYGAWQYHFDPKRFYEYMWMCFNQGRGWRSWRQNPEMPMDTEKSAGDWYRSRSATIVDAILKKWHRGTGLEEIVHVEDVQSTLYRANLGLEGQPLAEGTSVFGLEDLDRRQ